MKNFANRFPGFHDIIPVYAVAAFMLYAWSIGWFLWSLPSWLMFMTPGEILSGLCYVLSFSMVESLAFLLFLLAWCLLLPSRILRNDFIVRGSAATICFIGAIMLYFRFISNDVRLDTSLYFFLTLVLSVALLAAFLSTVVPVLRRAVVWISDNLIIFLYVLVPISFVSLIVVLVRNVI